MKTPTAIELIAVERQRQIESEGFGADHDDDYLERELADAASCYLHYGPFSEPERWPWDTSWWKPSNGSGPEDHLRDMVKAGALVVAEIERLQRAMARTDPADRDRHVLVYVVNNPGCNLCRSSGLNVPRQELLRSLTRLKESGFVTGPFARVFATRKGAYAVGGPEESP